MGFACSPARAAVLLLAPLTVALALTAAPQADAAPGLPRTYVPRIIDSPAPLGTGSFGWGIASADLTGDTELDLLVAQAAEGLPNGGRGKVFIFDGVSGTHVDTIEPPENNPDSATTPETLAFVYIETMPDVGSCPGGDGPDAGRICDAPVVGPTDTIPEIIVGSRNLRVNVADTSTAPQTTDPRLGRGYVFDGATRAVLKRIDMPLADRQAQLAVGGAGVAPHFARTMTNPAGLEPCAGQRSENANFGIGICPDKPTGDRIGDLNGDGVGDIVITARNYVVRTGAPAGPAEEYAAAGSQCRNAASGSTCTAGKAWAYSGAIAGSPPGAILDTPLYSIQNPRAQTTGSPEFGGNLTRLGDISADARPEFVIPARNVDYPLGNPDTGAGNPGENVGASFLFNGATGALIRTIPNPEPQPRSQFGGGFNSGRAAGDLGATGTSDFLQAAPLQNAASTDDGQAWVFNGDLAAGGGAEQSWNFATLTDPNPAIGGNFGGAFTGVGDLVDGPGAPANEVLIGGNAFDTFTQASADLVADLHIMNPTFQKELQRIPHPEANSPSGGRGDGFGVGITPMGDLNDDGFLDFAASAYLANVGMIGGQGRAYIFTSDDSPLPSGPSAPPGEAFVTPNVLRAGRCANETRGTNRSETLLGTVAGDRMYGFAGDDVIHGLDSRDCLHGGRGSDRLRGAGDNDKLLGAGGSDSLHGGDGRDRLFGATGADRLVGGVSRDLLAGGAGADRLSGGPEGDRLFGERGNDRIGTGDGNDSVDAGPGNDRVNSRNRERDDVICGAGIDVVIADRRDRIDGSCEQVRLPE